MGFIWLPSKSYPDKQTTYLNPLTENKGAGNYTVCSVCKKYVFDSLVTRLDITFSADTACLLKINGEIIARGPAYSGGDFLNNENPRNDYYSLYFEHPISAKEVLFEGIVRMMPYHLCEYSKGQGGFYLNCVAHLKNGETCTIYSDDSWDIYHLNTYTQPRCFDNSLPPQPTVKAEIKKDIWQPEVAPILPCTLENLSRHTYKLGAKEKFKKTVEFDKIHACYLTLEVKTTEKANINICTFETDERTHAHYGTYTKDDTYYGLELFSVGGYDIEISNEGESDCEITVIFDSSFYPVNSCAMTETSDKELNTLLDICTHTLKYCRQLHHLDSPKHCEPLACAGDYYVEMLMTLYSYGDLSLCEFDLKRIARTMTDNDGRLFHTTYSLIWVKMLYECYMATGNIELLRDCKGALDLLLNRFDSYMGENGLVETPPDYMFIDWLFPDGISTHHPPKALGQTCLNMFLYGALNYASYIYNALDFKEKAEKQIIKAKALKEAIITHLYDKEKGLFFEGLNTKTPEEMLWQYLPKNVEKRYYRRHANILACYFGIVDKNDAKKLLEKVYNDDTLGEVQPYFMHFWFGAIYNNGLCEKYTLPLLNLWKEAIKVCPKGLPEGFYKPEPTYNFDHSHAWGGSPLYSLPQALSGLEILEPRFKKISLKPQLLGLEFANLEIATPYGIIRIESSKNGVKIEAPKEITII